MNRPPFEVADIIRAHGNRFIEKNRSWLTWLQLRVLPVMPRFRDSIRNLICTANLFVVHYPERRHPTF